MKRLLIILGLIIIPFYEIILRFLPFVGCNATDSRMTKEILAMIFALSIGLLAVFNGEVKPFKNKWLLMIPIYLLFNLFMAPHFDMFVNNVESGDFYFWKPFSEVLCFSLMIFAVSSMKIDFNEIIKVMVICGVVMAGYVILQKIGLDQFFIPREGEQFIKVHGRVMGGNLGQPTIVASWMIMMVPLAFYLRKFWMAYFIIGACLLTQGAMVAIALGTILLITMFHFYKELRKFIIISLIVLFSLFSLCMGNNSIRHKVIERMDGRYEVWKATLKDIHNGPIDNIHKYPLTGLGLGRFSYVFPSKNNSIFMQVHNEPLEFLYDCGLIGIFLLFYGLFIMLSNIHLIPISFSILLSFIAILFCSLGTFTFQLGAHQFYSALLIGMLNNDSIIGRIL